MCDLLDYVYLFFWVKVVGKFVDLGEVVEMIECFVNLFECMMLGQLICYWCILLMVLDDICQVFDVLFVVEMMLLCLIFVVMLLLLEDVV